MAQNQQFSSQNTGPQVDPAQLQNLLQSMLQQSATIGSSALSTFSQLQELRAARLADAAKAISDNFGKNHPDAAAVQTLADATNGFKAQLDVQATHLKSWPKPRSNEWIVFGTVTDAQDDPQSGLTVRVFDKDRKLDDLLGETSTDENGSFSVVYHERDFKETGENLPDLYVMVSDPTGQLLYSTQDRVRFEAGRSEYFAIRLGKRSGRAQGKTASDDTPTRITRRKK
jgi:hypothetical protein